MMSGPVGVVVVTGMWGEMCLPFCGTTLIIKNIIIKLILQLEIVNLMHNLVCEGEINAHYKSTVHLMNTRCTKKVHISD